MTGRDIIDVEMQPSLLEFKQHLRITSSDQDALLMQCLKSALTAAENHIGRYLAKSVFKYVGKFAQTITLERIDENLYPLERIVSVKVDGEVMLPTSYTITDDVFSFNADVTGDKMELIYVAGGRYVEHDIKAAILLTASKYYNNPVDSVETLPSVATNLLGSYRRWKNA